MLSDNTSYATDWGSVKSNVSQGTLLGPVLFFVYIMHIYFGVHSPLLFYGRHQSDDCCVGVDDVRILQKDPNKIYFLGRQK